MENVVSYMFHVISFPEASITWAQYQSEEKEAKELFLLHNCNSQGYPILSKYRFTSIIIAQVMNFHPNESLKMVFDIRVSGKITLTPLI